VNILTWLAAAFFLLGGSAVFPAEAAFNAFYVFGDGACTTTNNGATPPTSNYYYGKRYSNGRVWVEVLTQRQGLTYDANKNWSYFGQSSSALVSNVSHFIVPANATNALFAVWACDADFVLDMEAFGGLTDASYGTNITLWTNAIATHLSNHLTAITNLYAKGVRNLIALNAVDITKIPSFNGLPAANQFFVRQRISNFNTEYVELLNVVRNAYPGLKIWIPDIFTLLDDVEAHAANYGLTNLLNSSGIISDAIDAGLTVTNGAGTNCVFWDPFDPTAKFHEVIADVVQQMVSPAVLTGLTNGSDGIHLAASSLPLGLGGYVEGRTNLLSGSWVSEESFNSTNLAQSLFVPAATPPHFYRLRFPYAWSWP